MKPISMFLFFAFLISFSSHSQITDIQKLRENLLHDALVNQGYKPRVERYITSDYSKTENYLTTLNSEGGWGDIEYNDRDNNWHPLNHLGRLLVMAYNYRKDTSQWYQNPELLAGLERAIGYWYTINPECDNWYKNKIAKQFYFNIIALLLEGEIDPSLHLKMVNDLTENPTMTGSNRTLLAISTFYKGVLENDSNKIKLGVSGVTDQIAVTTKEGVQPDYSFHQHGKFIYNGSYGFNYLRESIWLATIVHGTQFAFPDYFIKVLRDYYLEGTRWMIRGGLIDYNVRGRQVGRGDAMKLYGDLLIPILKHMIIADPDFTDEYQTSFELIKKQQPQNTIGHKHFWRSDYTIHHRPKYSTSLKMCSKRTVGIELNMNTENKLGYWLPYGLTYIYRRGNEYDGIFPVWDWARLPGVTNPYVEIEEKRKGVAYTQQTEFVGGVSNGQFGVSAMDFSKNNTRAKKAWFWFDDEWVALGAGIESLHKEPVVTGINQCIQTGNVLVDGKNITDRKTINNPGWILHDSIGYVFPVKSKIELNSGVQSGNIRRIYGLGEDSIYSQQVFSLWFNHGKQSRNERYEYIVIPGIGEKSLEEYAKKPNVRTIVNTNEIQAVQHKQLGITGIAFHKSGEIQIDNDLVFGVTQPLIVLLDTKKNEITVCEPTSKYTSVQVYYKYRRETIYMQIPIEKSVRLGMENMSITSEIKEPTK